MDIRLYNSILYRILLGLIALIVIGACSKQSPPANPQNPTGRPALPPAPVSVATVVKKDTPVELTNFGHVEEYSSVEVKSRITGYLTQVHFVEGQKVKQNDLLLSIDPRESQVALKAAQANLQRDQAQLQNALREADRQTQLLEKGIAAQDTYDAAITAVETLRAAILADQAAIDKAHLQIEYCSVRSPIDGCVGKLHIYPGNLVRADDTAVINIRQVDPIYVSFPVPQQHLSTIRRLSASGDLKVRAIVPESPGDPIQGRLSFIDNSIDPDSLNIRMRATFANPEWRLWPGQYVDVVLSLQTEIGSIVIPSQAIQTGQKDSFVYVVKSDKTVERRPVTVRRSLDSESVVENLQPDEIIVTDGQLRLIPGAKVVIPESKTE
ncbi:MAG: efflux RND transporter periplasmic adaptor subunit [Phycisphaerae bacterium]|nr:efflux RND transporter periplasmic adaptor subunit [Phycisphaerae bacterium]